MKNSNYLEGLGSNRRSEPTKAKLLLDLHEGRFERLTEEDSFKVGLPVVYVVTKGRGKREVLQEAHFIKGDTGRIGKCWGEIYLHDEAGKVAIPRRFKTNSDRILKVIQ